MNKYDEFLQYPSPSQLPFADSAPTRILSANLSPEVFGTLAHAQIHKEIIKALENQHYTICSNNSDLFSIQNIEDFDPSPYVDQAMKLLEDTLPDNNTKIYLEERFWDFSYYRIGRGNADFSVYNPPSSTLIADYKTGQRNISLNDETRNKEQLYAYALGAYLKHRLPTNSTVTLAIIQPHFGPPDILNLQVQDIVNWGNSKYGITDTTPNPWLGTCYQTTNTYSAKYPEGVIEISLPPNTLVITNAQTQEECILSYEDFEQALRTPSDKKGFICCTGNRSAIDRKNIEQCTALCLETTYKTEIDLVMNSITELFPNTLIYEQPIATNRSGTKYYIILPLKEPITCDAYGAIISWIWYRIGRENFATAGKAPNTLRKWTKPGTHSPFIKISGAPFNARRLLRKWHDWWTWQGQQDESLSY